MYYRYLLSTRKIDLWKYHNLFKLSIETLNILVLRDAIWNKKNRFIKSCK